MRVTTVICVLFLSVVIAAAEVGYVDCKGTGGLPALSGKNPPVQVAMLACGQEVRVLDADSTWTHIRLQNGSEAYAASDFLVTELQLRTYQQQNNIPKVLEVGQRLLQIKPSNLLALAMLSYYAHAEAWKGGANSAELLVEAGQWGTRGLQALESANKPETFTDERWVREKEKLRSIFNASAGHAAYAAKDYSTAQRLLKEAVTADPNYGQAIYILALSYLVPQDRAVDGLFWIARATALAPTPQVQQQVGNYGRRAYTMYHGSDDGWDQMVADAKNQTTIPAGFTVKAGKHKLVTIQVVDAQSSQSTYTYTIPGEAEKSKTTCNTDGTAYTGPNYGYGTTTSIDGTTNCTTTTAPATPPSIGYGANPVEVSVHAIMPDGRHVTVWCRDQWLPCRKLDPGFYQAELKGDVVWIDGLDLSGKKHKIKYRATGGW